MQKRFGLCFFALIINFERLYQLTNEKFGNVNPYAYLHYYVSLFFGDGNRI